MDKDVIAALIKAYIADEIDIISLSVNDFYGGGGGSIAINYRKFDENGMETWSTMTITVNVTPWTKALGIIPWSNSWFNEMTTFSQFKI